MPVTTWRFGRVSLSGYIMLCGTSERFPVSASIHLNVKVRQNQFATKHGRMKEPGTNLGHLWVSASCVKHHAKGLMRWLMRAGETANNPQYTR
jgi:hypothetical protein